MSSFSKSRWRHLATLLPLGAAVGFLAGLGFSDVLSGLGIGVGFGLLYGLWFAFRNPK
ncbi:MAG: hypothetical protein AB1778_03405 [Candidatus Bipolaricaulota bacterium]